MPNQISQIIFDILKEESQNNIDVRFDYQIDNKNVHIDNILDKMYILDENDLPPSYKLVEANKLIPGFQIKVNFDNIKYRN